MGKLIGTDFSFIADSSAIAYAKTFEYTLTGNYAESTTLNDGKWDSYVPAGGKNFEGSLESFVMRDTDSSRGFNYFLNCWFNDVSIAVQYKPVTGSDDYITGAVFVSDIKVANPGNKDLVTYSASLKGCGQFTLVS